MNERSFLGYPPSYRQELKFTLGCAAGCLPFALMPGAAAVVWFLALCERWRFVDFARFVGCVVVFFICVLVLRAAFTAPRIWLGFEREPGPDRLAWRFDLRALARNWGVLEALAAEGGLTPLSKCAFDKTEWHAPGPALATVRGLQVLIRGQAGRLRGAKELRGELELVEDALVKAVDRGVRIRLDLFG